MPEKKSAKEEFLIDSISSGESSLFCTFNFISSNIDHDTWLLIDEPENSLHPKWQKNYCRNLIDNFKLYEPKIIIATHSPMVVSGASISGDIDSVFSPQTINPQHLSSSEGVESLLMDVFDTITPKNHHLSEQAQILLDNLANKEVSINYVLATIKEWQSKTSEVNQLHFLDDLIELAYNINNKNNYKEI